VLGETWYVAGEGKRRWGHGVQSTSRRACRMFANAFVHDRTRMRLSVSVCVCVCVCLCVHAHKSANVHTPATERT